MCLRCLLVVLWRLRGRSSNRAPQGLLLPPLLVMLRVRPPLQLLLPQPPPRWFTMLLMLPKVPQLTAHLRPVAVARVPRRLRAAGPHPRPKGLASLLTR